jgi:phosphoribosylamine---glycine ligase
MSILILGSGAREKVIKEKLENKIEGETKAKKVYIYDNTDFEEIKNFCLKHRIELVIPSTEVYLCNGIVDYLINKINGIKVFGPTKNQAQIEGSKHFSKKLMTSLHIPTSKYQFFLEKKAALDYIHRFYSFLQLKQIVIKYSGLASGKGVYLPNNREEAEKSIEELYEKNEKNWEGVVIETRVKGKEVSVLGFCNGQEAFLMPQAQDYKRIYDDDKGANTGGMGAICPANILDDKEMMEVNVYMDRIVKKLNYRGVLYAGIMKTDSKIFFLEFNCRFGDPEAQVILNLLDEDTSLEQVIKNCIRGNNVKLKWKTGAAATVILSHIHYPYGKTHTPVEIEEGDLDETVTTYESNVIYKNNKKYTTGGRVLSMVSVSNTVQKSLENIYNNIYKITYDGVYYRRDIGVNDKGYRKTKYEKLNTYEGTRQKNVSIGVLASGKATSIEGLFEDTCTSKCIKVFIANEMNNDLVMKARTYGVPYINLGNNYSTSETKKKYYEQVVDMLHLFKVDIVILSGYMQIVPDILYNDFYTINIHPSLLPKYKGMKGGDIHKLKLMNDEKFIGCTLHEVTGDVDGGRILLQRQAILDKTKFNLQIRNMQLYEVKKQIQSLEKSCIYDFIMNYDTYKTTYDIDIDESNEFVDDLKNSGLIKNNFCAMYEHNGIQFGASTDGCGTKLDMANEHGLLGQIGIDLVAMNVNDLLAGGCKPMFFMDYIAIDKMDKNKCKQIVKGIIKGCEKCDCKLIGGETAEMKGIYLKNKLDLAGFAVGEKVYDLPKFKSMNKDCYLYGLKSSGIHSNGYTLVKKLWDKSERPMKPPIRDILTPTKIYSELLDIYKKYKGAVLGVAHITGGGFHDNIKRILPEHLSFELDHWEFPYIFKWIQRESKLSRDEMLNIFNCGYGMVLVTNREIYVGDKIGRIK